MPLIFYDYISLLLPGLILGLHYLQPGVKIICEVLLDSDHNLTYLVSILGLWHSERSKMFLDLLLGADVRFLIFIDNTLFFELLKGLDHVVLTVPVRN